MDIAKASVQYKTVTLAITLVVIFAGFFCYGKLGQLEDPEFTIKEALVITSYPGASAVEVEEEISEPLETAIQELGQLKRIKNSLSRPGLSIISVEIQDKYDKHTLPQVWDELRRKVGDAQSELPPGASKPIVYDDYGDVFGVLIAITGKDYNYRELKDHADFLKRELLLVNGVGKIISWGEQKEHIYIEMSRAKMAQLGISPEQIYQTLAQQNLVSPSGAVRVGDEYLKIEPSGEIKTLAAVENLLINNPKSKRIIYLKDVADVTRGYQDPPAQHLRVNGEKAIALGVSTASGGNVVKVGKALAERIKQLQSQTPLGINIDAIYYQGSIVEQSVNGFVINLIEAIIIVIVVLMFFMGLRSGLLIGAVLMITVCSTILLMYLYSVNLERISLGALIIALGMLVDNAIVVTEGILVKIGQGIDRLKAASEVVQQTMWPLLGATAIAVLAFAAIGLSQDSTGEYLRSLFKVMLFSLGMSWITAMTITPLLCVLFLKADKDDADRDPYQGIVFTIYRGLLTTCLRFKWLTITAVIGLLAIAIIGFQTLEDSFFPDSTSKQFMVHYWLPQGTDIRKTSSDVKKLEQQVARMAGVTTVSSFIGAGAPRYMLVYSPEKSYSSYALLLVNVDDYQKIDGLIGSIASTITKDYPAANPKFEKVQLGPGGGYSIEARFSGDDPNVLRGLAEQAKNIIAKQAAAYSIRDDWRARVKEIKPIIGEAQARRLGISRKDIADALQINFSGKQVGIYREGDELIPITARAPENERSDISNIYNISVWSKVAQKSIPIEQLVTTFTTGWKDSIIQRRNKIRTLTVQAENRFGNASTLQANIQKEIEAIPLPIGYNLEWGGEYENSNDAKAALFANIPATLLIMVLITIMLFNGLRQPLIIWLTVPLAIIGVTFGLLVTNEPFGFMALLGFLSLSGMLIKNAIVLLDEIELQKQTSTTIKDAIITASVSRVRPVTMAAITTILGMAPLLTDVFFYGMAVTIMFGLAFATLLTLLIIPVFYSVLFHDRTQESIRKS